MGGQQKKGQQQQNQQQGKPQQRGQQGREQEQYVGAPYNFIPLNVKVNKKEEDQLQPHHQIDPGKKSGMIEYTITAETPIMISDGTGKFYRNVYNQPAIPGSTVRGLVRSNMQILSFSSVADDIQNGKFMYRNVANGNEKKHYNDVLGNETEEYSLPNGKKGKMSVLKNVRAGYIRNLGNDHYVILQTASGLGDMNYYVLSERKIIEGKDEGFRFLLEHHPYILQHQNEAFHRKTDKNGRVHYVGKENENYHPYYIKVSYELSGKRNVTGIDEWGKLSKNGYLVLTGKMREKKAIYVIPEINESKDEIPIPQNDIDDFKRDYEGRKHQVEAMEGKEKGFFNLPAVGETKPVFYIQLNGKLYFGFTPRLRLFYDKEIHDGLNNAQKTTRVDYCKSIFGYSDQKGSYRSRVSFLDAEIVKGEESTEDVELILASPKPSSYHDYLASQSGDVASYNDDKFELRGVKQYWLKKEVVTGATGDNKKVYTGFRPYKSGTEFKGTIRFENLSDEELGMLLWSLVLEENSRQNIGMAKAYGYGRICVKVTELKLLKYDEMYNSANLLLKPYDTQDLKECDSYIMKAKEEMTKFLGFDIMKHERVKQFFMMKDAMNIPDNEKTRYMSIEKREYQWRVSKRVTLPLVEDVLNPESIATCGKYKKSDKIDDSAAQGRKNCDKKKGRSEEDKNWKSYQKNKGKYNSQKIGTGIGELLKGIQLDN